MAAPAGRCVLLAAASDDPERPAVPPVLLRVLSEKGFAILPCEHAEPALAEAIRRPANDRPAAGPTIVLLVEPDEHPEAAALGRALAAFAPTTPVWRYAESADPRLSAYHAPEQTAAEQPAPGAAPGPAPGAAPGPAAEPEPEPAAEPIGAAEPAGGESAEREAEPELRPVVRPWPPRPRADRPDRPDRRSEPAADDAGPRLRLAGDAGDLRHHPDHDGDEPGAPGPRGPGKGRDAETTPGRDREPPQTGEPILSDEELSMLLEPLDEREHRTGQQP